MLDKNVSNTIPIIIRSSSNVFQTLERIFSYLTLPERKSARLVCRKWYEAASPPSILKNEKLVCVNEGNNVFKTLSESVYCWRDFQFHGFRIHSKSLQFWEEKGSRIHSLHFDNCEFTREAARSIIIRCNSLKTLSLKRCRGFFEVFVDCKNELLRHIQRDSLKSIEIAMDEDMSDHVLEQIFKVFPAIEKLALRPRLSYCAEHKLTLVGCRYLCDRLWKANEEDVSKKLSPSAVHEILKRKVNVIREFEYTEADSRNYLCNNFFESVSRIQNLKLSSFVFHAMSENVQTAHETMERFFCDQRTLQRIVLDRSTFCTPFCEYILDNCRNLGYLEVRDFRPSDLRDRMTLPSNLPQKIANSDLETLKLDFHFSIEERQEQDAVPTTNMKKKLRTLSINWICVSSRDIWSIVCFHDLKCLNLGSRFIDDTLVQSVLHLMVRGPLFWQLWGGYFCVLKDRFVFSGEFGNLDFGEQ